MSPFIIYGNGKDSYINEGGGFWGEQAPPPDFERKQGGREKRERKREKMTRGRENGRKMTKK